MHRPHRLCSQACIPECPAQFFLSQQLPRVAQPVGTHHSSISMPLIILSSRDESGTFMVHMTPACLLAMGCSVLVIFCWPLPRPCFLHSCQRHRTLPASRKDKAALSMACSGCTLICFVFATCAPGQAGPWPKTSAYGNSTGSTGWGIHICMRHYCSCSGALLW